MEDVPADFMEQVLVSLTFPAWKELQQICGLLGSMARQYYEQGSNIVYKIHNGVLLEKQGIRLRDMEVIDAESVGLHYVYSVSIELNSDQPDIVIDKELFSIITSPNKYAFITLQLFAPNLQKDWIKFISSWKELRTLQIVHPLRNSLLELFKTLCSQHQLRICGLESTHVPDEAVPYILDMIVQTQFMCLHTTSERIVKTVLTLWNEKSSELCGKRIIMNSNTVPECIAHRLIPLVPKETPEYIAKKMFQLETWGTLDVAKLQDPLAEEHGEHEIYVICKEKQEAPEGEPIHYVAELELMCILFT
ncbi:hypothetical protein QR680_003170 [Steinernema hermaphroditum]|uniref:Uncharacterized protein n=1 Tax=Steinernema hermaphroditum TaxID=289476 RepID=A0AA39H7J8_9BILA|nr:hypothetical protein QR680_003170 [Steinernema hermaphroditum]